MAHTNEAVLECLFNSLDRHDHEAMAVCYHPEATFQDIAFGLRGRKEIHGMWHMICEGDIRVKFDVVEANDEIGRVHLVDDYTFRSTGRKVHNLVESHFCFSGGTIIQQQDFCDPRHGARWRSAVLPDFWQEGCIS